MSTYNLVRFRVQPGQDEAFLDAHRNGKADWPGLSYGVILRTGDHSYCLIGEWPDQESLAEARSQMIVTLNSFRHVLDELPGGLGVTDAVSGPIVLDLKSTAADA